MSYAAENGHLCLLDSDQLFSNPLLPVLQECGWICIRIFGIKVSFWGINVDACPSHLLLQEKYASRSPSLQPDPTEYSICYASRPLHREILPADARKCLCYTVLTREGKT